MGKLIPFILGAFCLLPLLAQAEPSRHDLEALKRIVEQGPRALKWFERLQDQLPEAERSPLWTVPSVQDEPTPERPRRLSVPIVLAAWESHIRQQPELAAVWLWGQGDLPVQLPGSVPLMEALDWLRKIKAVYAAASRFLALYPYRNRLPAPQAERFARTPMQVRLHPSAGQWELDVFNIGASELALLQRWLDEGWNRPGEWQVRLRAVSQFKPGVLGLKWVAGVPAQMNRVGGDWMILDANLGAASEQMRVTFLHEFGHVLGFADCYFEFWSEAEQAFLYYSLDPTNRMCALGGETLPQHYQALRNQND